MVNADLDRSLVESLHNPACYPHPVASVRLLETHISWVLLAGDFAYKIKKPVDFGFLDFSDLDKRRYFCHEELRLNRRLAPALYLEVIAIGGSADNPDLGGGPAFEYAVKMRRFAEDDLLDHMLTHRRLTLRQLELLAATMARFHAGLPSATVESGYGDAAAVALPARQNFQQLAPLLGQDHAARLEALQFASEKEYARCLPAFEQRLHEGWIRECHGDLHLGNIVLLDGQPTPFDGIEFNPALRWIDTSNDIAFLMMDLQQRGRSDLAYVFVNTYLQCNGDYGGLAVLRFYLGYRAMVMAKVAAIRAAQLGKHAGLEPCQRYLALAAQYYAPSKPFLCITHGLPGCGKTTVSQLVLEKYQAIRLRSDVERKRLFGLLPQQASSPGLADGIYSQEATERTYRHLLALARQILQSGFSVVVDAAFLKQQERQRFQELARELGLPFVILTIQSADVLQRQRIRQRQAEQLDASEADVAVYELLKAASEPLSAEECRVGVEVLNNGGIEQLMKEQELWGKLDRLLKTA